jgi:hypothetical protein
MSSPDDFFHRPELAGTIADQALDTSMGNSGGLFLAAPRRTGKSTFVRQDLLPALASRNVVTIYVDLWIDRSVNPAIHIANAVRASLAAEDGVVAKWAKRALSATSLNIGALGSGLRFDLSALNMPSDATLTDALKALSMAHERKLVLVIDEAQHANTTPEGAAALFALKAARDSLNTDANMFGMQLIATGSNRDKLAALVNSREQAFYGADMLNFASLGKGYIQWIVDRSKLTLDVDRTHEVFREIGSRPEPLRKALMATKMQLASDSTLNPDDTLASLARADIEAAKADFITSVANLPPLQGAILRELAIDSAKPNGGGRDGVFSAAMKERLQARLDSELGQGHEVTPSSPNVQSALESLRVENYLWKSQRGTYSMEDEQYGEWLAEVDTHGQPPTDEVPRP